MLYLAGGVLIGLVLALVVYTVSVTAPPEPIRVPPGIPAPVDPAFLELVALSSNVHFSGGNRVDLLVDGGATFRRLFQDIRAAQRSVTLQLYFCQPGDLADRLADALADRARAGVRVLFLHDAFGSDLPDAYFEPLRAAGVDARAFRPVRWWTLHKAQERSHARIVVIDGRVAYTGGFGIDDRWSAYGTDEQVGWRDTNVRFTGPAVAALQAAFAAAWSETVGEVLVDQAFYPGLPDAGAGPCAGTREDGTCDGAGAGPGSGSGSASGSGSGSGSPDRPHRAPARLTDPVAAGVIHSRPEMGSSSAERLLALTIAAASRSLYIANAYFVPGRDFRALLTRAARSGVDVRVLAPSENCDIPIVRYAGRAYYSELMAAGVRVYEYIPAMMHAKTLVADGAWSMIGTINFDNRSLALNEEISLLAQDPDIGARMDDLFLRDLQQAVEITPESYARRPRHERVKERIARWGSRLL